MAAVLKFFIFSWIERGIELKFKRRYLGDMEIQNYLIVLFRYQRSPQWRLSELKLDGSHRIDMAILNCSNRSVPISKMAAMASIYKIFMAHGGYLEILQTSSSPKSKVGLSWNLKGGIWATWRFRITKIVCSNIQDDNNGVHLEILKKTSPPEWKVRLSWNLMGAIGSTWRFLKSFRSNIQDGRHGIPLSKIATMAAIWAETWWEPSDRHGNS